jgi:excinuclease UvrABC helicase subunit UvrB
LGSPEEYKEMNLMVKLDQEISKREIMERLVGIHFNPRTTADLLSGSFDL